ncbi:MAG: diguanylate cyclase [Desulfamplus sp.]|nr:diguanylate cyclase [Desulfamplus sp.]
MTVRLNDWLLWRKEGSSFDAEFVSTPIIDNRQLDGAVVLFSDISQRKQMENELKRLASVDALTGISNRRYFLERAEEEISRSIRYRHPLTFVMMDIDHFKNINDTHGHHVGDVVLKNVAAILQDTLRINDIFGRIGGEEFAAILPETSIENAGIVMERIRAGIEASVWEIDGTAVSCTMSMGMAMLINHHDLNNLMKDADAALYVAKDSGRNCIKTA